MKENLPMSLNPMNKIYSILACSLTVVFLGCSQEPAEKSKSHNEPGQNQTGAEPVTVDLDRDGKPDQVSLFLESTTGTIFIRYGSGISESKEFSVGSEQQFGICSGANISLKVTPQSHAVEEALGELPEGYRVCETCYEVKVVGDECDPLQFFWNEKMKAIDWWRA